MNYRKIYESQHGSIPIDADGRTYDIHHLDGNHSNNLPENLRAVSLQEHYDIHFSQGDWGACARIGERMKRSPEEISHLLSLENKKRVSNGTHHFLVRENARKRALKQVADGIHNFLDKEKARERNLKRSAAGTHPFQKRPDGTSPSSDRVTNGTHQFLGGEIQHESAKKRLANGTHNFTKSWKCEHCGREGKGDPNYNRWHGENCKSKS